MALMYIKRVFIRRSIGQTAMDNAAYCTGQKLYSTYYGEYANRLWKDDVVMSRISLPGGTPSEFENREKLWDMVEFSERSGDANIGMHYVISLQNEFSMGENIRLAQRFIDECFVSVGLICDWSVHNPKDRKIPNPHVHLLCPLRTLNSDGTWNQKGYKYIDENGKLGVKYVEWLSKGWNEYLRVKWCEMNNELFEMKGLSQRLNPVIPEKEDDGSIPLSKRCLADIRMERAGKRTARSDINALKTETDNELEIVNERINSLTQYSDAVKSKLAKLGRFEEELQNMIETQKEREILR